FVHERWTCIVRVSWISEKLAFKSTLGPDAGGAAVARMSSGSADGGGAAVRRTGTAEVRTAAERPCEGPARRRCGRRHNGRLHEDRKSTRLNSSHVKISYAVFCLKKKNKGTTAPT